MIFRSRRACAWSTALLLLLIGCGGGGGGGGTSGSNGPSSIVPAAPTSTPGAVAVAATATPSASPSSGATVSAAVSVTGNVADLDSGAPIAGASITTTDAGGTSSTLSAANGSFAFPSHANALVAITASAPGYAQSVQGYTVTGAGIRAIKLVAIGAEIAAWLTLVNADRAANGNAAPLVLNNELTIAARAQARDENTAGYLAHWNTAGQSATDQCILAGALACAQNDGIGFASATAAEAAFIAEKANCPGGIVATCPFAENTGHLINIVTSSGAVGLGASHANANAYTQDFALAPAAVTDPAVANAAGTAGQPVAIVFRTLTSGTYFANAFATTCPWTPFNAAALSAAAPGSPYPAGCTTSAPSAAGVTLVRNATDGALYTASFTPAQTGTYSIGLATSAGWAALAVVNVAR